MGRLTERDEYGNADIIALSDIMPELYAKLSYSETNALTETLNKLAAYEDAEENGTLVKLPCNVGDKRYFISSDGLIEKGVINTIQIVMTQDFYDKVFYISGVSREKWIGKDGMYRTREEAEKALKERENNG